jgi:WD40 repeat protein
VAEQKKNELTPYRGLVPYTEEDADFFFGRERERDEIISRLLASRLTVLYGPSGVGKSSVLRAGVAHYLRELSQDNLVESGSPEFAVIVFSLWRDEPLAGLSNHIRESLTTELGFPPQTTTNSPSFALALQGWAERIGGNLLIILDQFEEYFLYHGQESGKGTFAEEFPRVVNRPDLRINFLISIREDALAQLDRFKSSIPNIFKNTLRIKPLSKEAARLALTLPIKEYNLQTGAQPPYTIESELVEAVCEEVETGRASLGHNNPAVMVDLPRPSKEETGIEAPYLQLVMTRVWNEEKKKKSHALRRETLVALGGADLILKMHLDDVMHTLSKDKQRIASRVFFFLVTSSRTKIALTAEDLSDFTKIHEAVLTPVLENLAQSEVRILRTVPSTLNKPAEPRYEIFHDVLGPAILDWSTRYAQDEDRARAEQESKDNLERERRRSTRLTFILFGALLVVILLVLMIRYIGQKNNEAVRAQNEAVRAQNEAETQKARAEKEKNSAQEMLNVIHTIDRSAPYFKAIMRGHEGGVNDVVFSPDGKLVATASDDKTAQLWKVETEFNNNLLVLKGHTDTINSIAFSPDGKLVLTASEDNTARLWKVEDGESVATLKGHTAPVNNAAFSPDGKFAVTSSVDGTARLWNASTGQFLLELKGHTGEVNTAVFSPDSRFVATASADGTAHIWSALSGESLVIVREHQNKLVAKEDKDVEILKASQGVINQVAFSPDGKLLVTANTDGDVQIWDAQTGANIALLNGHKGSVNDASFSPDGKLIVTASSDHTARIWDVGLRKTVAELKGHADAVLSAIFSPDGNRIITTSTDRTSRVWEVSTGGSLFELHGHTDRVNKAAFSPDGNLAVTASGDTTARIWDLTGASGLRVSQIFLHSNPENYSGHCPATITLSGKIIVSGGSGSVTYKFVRSNGPPSSIKTLVFDSPGTKDVTSIWRFGGSINPSPSGSFYLEVLTPQHLRTPEVKFNIKCDLPEEDTDEPEPSPAPSKVSPSNNQVFESRPHDIILKWLPVPDEIAGDTKYLVSVKLYDARSKESKTISKYTVEHSVSILTDLNWNKGRWRVNVDRPGLRAPVSDWWEFSVTR